jgi:hypothetical protein
MKLNRLKSIWIICLCTAYLSACTTLDTSKATSLKAYPPDASVVHDPQLSEADLQNMEENGVIYEYSQGDVVNINIQNSSDIFETDPISPINLKIKKKLYVYSGVSGIYLSSDGKNYHRFNRFFKGSFAVNLGMKKSTRTNDLDLKFSLVVEPH